MPTNLLILPLLGGYWLVHHSHRYRFRAQHLDGYRLLLESALAGALLLILSRGLVLLIKLTGWGLALKQAWDTSVAPGIPYLGTGLLAALLGLLIPAIDNRIPHLNPFRRVSVLLARKLVHRRIRRFFSGLGVISRSNAEVARSREIFDHANGLKRLIHQAEIDGSLISVTLDNSKWYVGYIAEALNLDPNETCFRILPILSGYRHRETLTIVRQTYYVPVYQSGFDPADFHITIPLQSVKTASLFDVQAYNEYFAADEDRREQDNK